MGWLTRLSVSAVVAFGAMFATQGANATTYNFNLGSLSTSATKTFTMGTWSLSFDQLTSTSSSGCYYTLGGSGNGSCSNVNITAEIRRGVLTLTFSNATGGDLVTGGTTNNAGRDNDLYLNFNVNTPTATQTISQVSLAVSGASTTASNAVAKEYICKGTVASCTTGSGNYYDTLSVTPSAAADTYAAGASAQSSLSIRKDLFVTSSAYHIVTMTQRYVSNPEPISMTVLGVGLAGLAVARRRNGRRALRVA